jgi:hypothetical protein
VAGHRRFSPDDTAGTFGDAFAVDLISDLPTSYARQYATVGAVTAVVARGNMLAVVTLYLGSERTPSDESNFVQNILPIAVGKLSS